MNNLPFSSDLPCTKTVNNKTKTRGCSHVQPLLCFEFLNQSFSLIWWVESWNISVFLFLLWLLLLLLWMQHKLYIYIYTHIYKDYNIFQYIFIGGEFWQINYWIIYSFYILHTYKISRKLKINSYVINKLFKL